MEKRWRILFSWHCLRLGTTSFKTINHIYLSYSKHGIAGRHVTPFILKRVNELTGGKSLLASILGTVFYCMLWLCLH